MILLDTNVYIYFLEKNLEFFQNSESAIKKALLHGPIPVPTITIMEIRSGTDDNKVLDFFNGKQFQICGLTTEIAVLAGKLRYENRGLKAADAIHIATAIEQKATCFITNDKKLISLNLKGIDIQWLSELNSNQPHSISEDKLQALWKKTSYKSDDHKLTREEMNER